MSGMLHTIRLFVCWYQEGSSGMQDRRSADYL